MSRRICLLTVVASLTGACEYELVEQTDDGTIEASAMAIERRGEWSDVPGADESGEPHGHAPHGEQPPVVIIDGYTPRRSEALLGLLEQQGRRIERARRQLREIERAESDEELRERRLFIQFLVRANGSLHDSLSESRAANAEQEEKIARLRRKLQKLKQDGAQDRPEQQLRLETAILLDINQTLNRIADAQSSADDLPAHALELCNNRPERLRLLVVLRRAENECVFLETAIELDSGSCRSLPVFAEGGEELSLEGTEVFLFAEVLDGRYSHELPLEELMADRGFLVTLGESGAERTVALVPDSYRGKKNSLRIRIGPGGVTTD